MQTEISVIDVSTKVLPDEIIFPLASKSCSVQSILDNRFQPSGRGISSVTLNVPGGKVTDVAFSLSISVAFDNGGKLPVKKKFAVKLNSCDSPSGIVCFSIIILDGNDGFSAICISWFPGDPCIPSNDMIRL